MSSARSSLLIAEIQRDLLSLDKFSAFFTLICSYRRDSCEVNSFISPTSVSTAHNRAQNHPTRKRRFGFVYTFGTPIWRRSNGCYDFRHVI